jgi:hypothetical protein
LYFCRVRHDLRELICPHERNFQIRPVTVFSQTDV